MNEKEALDLVQKCIEAASTSYDGRAINRETNLVDEGILDSLDTLAFVFELETHIGKKIPEIDEDFDDFRVSTFVEFLTALTES